jgi:hypothetical protein
MPDSENIWSINETLLQSYRSIFISSQSFLLAVGAIVLEKNNIVLFLLAGLSLFMVWFIWFPVVLSRHKIVDYYKYGSGLSQIDRTQLCSEHEYVHDRKRRDKANKLFGIRTNWRKTRWKIDLLIPIFISVIWIILIILEV